MCSYCGCESIEVIGRFMAEHVEVINACGTLREAVLAGDEDSVTVCRQRVHELLWPHTQAEEVGLFTVLARQAEFAAHIETLCSEHGSLATALDAVTAGDTQAMTQFEDLLREHINKEDNGLFPAAAIALAGGEWAEVNRVTPGASGFAPVPARSYDLQHAHPHPHHHDQGHGHGHDHDHGHDARSDLGAKSLPA